MDWKQYITFRIDGHLMGLDVLKVREINRVLDITPVPRAPEYVRGLVNLRGQILTVFDLGIRLGFGPREITDETHNVIMKKQDVGLLVDTIGDVMVDDSGTFEPPPANLDGIETDFIDGVVKMDQELLVVLSSEKLLSGSPASRQPTPGLQNFEQ